MANEKRLIEANDLWQKTFVCDEVAEVRKFIENAPTVDAEEVVHGRWIYEPVEFSIVKDIRCSVCRRYVGVPENYCPDCGAKMDGDGDGK